MDRCNSIYTGRKETLNKHVGERQACFLIFLSFLCPCTLEYLMLVNEGNSECFRVTSVYRKQSRLAICSCLDREDSNGFFYGFEFLK